MSNELFERHKALLDLALAATATRGAFNAWPDNPADYNDVLAAEGRQAFANYCDSYFYLDQPGVGERIGRETSPYGFELGIQYPKTNLASIMSVAQRAGEAWSKVELDTRAGVLLEILHQLNTRSFELAQATMHTTGLPFDLAFTSGGPHAQERGLEALALTYNEMKSIPAESLWERGEGAQAVRIKKTFKVVGRGISLTIGCSTQPNWSAYPGMFASLMAGNALLVKPHAHAVLPLAITVGVMRHVLKDAGFDADLVMLVVDDEVRAITQSIATRPEIKIIDYTGNPDFAAWLLDSAQGKVVHCATAAVNPVVVDGTADLPGLLKHLVHSVARAGGRTCLSPRVIFTASAGVQTPAGGVTTEEFDERLTQAFQRFTNDATAACALMGALPRHDFDARIDGAAMFGEVLVESQPLTDPMHPDGYFRSPLVVRVRPDHADSYMHEWFGPIVFLVECETIADALTRAAALTREKGAIVASLYSLDAGVCAAAEEAFGSTGATLCLNFTGEAYPGSSAAFSDFHLSGMNPSGNSTLTDSAFVAGRFRVVQTKTLL
ncbi:MAG: aldehyde dehydrogenase [Betaproteobacteria bacterium]|nr:aldehyde dehydrogenase [Betaproteobacteria bacterium]